MLTDSHKHT